MKKTIAFLACGLLATLALIPDVFAGTFNSFCQYMPYFRDNLTIKADISDGQLRIDQEGSFRVYLYTTMSEPFRDAKLDVLSEQFEAEVTPSPAWKTYPDVPSAAKGGEKQYFTIKLKRKAGTPDGTYDIGLKLFSSRATYRRLAAFLPLAEALDEHRLPLRPALSVDGQPHPQKWAAGLLVKDFMSYRMEGRFLKSYSPSAQTRLHLAADKENLYLLVLAADVGPGSDLTILASPTLEGKPTAVKLDLASGHLSAEGAADGLRAIKCPDDSNPDGSLVTYEVKIPRAALGIAGSDSFFMNFCRSARRSADDSSPELSYWRGNDISVREPVVYGKMIVDAKK